MLGTTPRGKKWPLQWEFKILVTIPITWCSSGVALVESTRSTPRKVLKGHQSYTRAGPCITKLTLNPFEISSMPQIAYLNIEIGGGIIS